MKSIVSILRVLAILGLSTITNGQDIVYYHATTMALYPADVIHRERDQIVLCLEAGRCDQQHLNQKAYERAKKRYLKQGGADKKILRYIQYVDHFYAETLDELAQGLLTEARELLADADGKRGKIAPKSVHDELYVLKGWLNNYHKMGVRMEAMKATVEQMEAKMEALMEYRDTEAYAQALLDDRTIMRAEVHDQVSEDRVRVACYGNYGGTVYQVNLIHEWTIYRDDFNRIISMSNTAMASFKDEDDKCWLVTFSVEREHAGGGRYMEPSVLVNTESKQPMPCKNVNR